MKDFTKPRKKIIAVFTAMFLVCTMTGASIHADEAADLTLTGTVVDKATGNPISGVTVSVGADNDVITDVNGKFTLNDYSGRMWATVNDERYEKYTSEMFEYASFDEATGKVVHTTNFTTTIELVKKKTNTFTEGANSIWKLNDNSINALYFVADADLSKLSSVKVNGTVLQDSSYMVDATTGDFMLNKDYLNTLTTGDYTLTLEIVMDAATGAKEITTTFSVVNPTGVTPPKNTVSPKTSTIDFASEGSFIILAGIAITVLLIKKRKLNS